MDQEVVRCCARFGDQKYGCDPHREGVQGEFERILCGAAVAFAARGHVDIKTMWLIETRYAYSAARKNAKSVRIDGTETACLLPDQYDRFQRAVESFQDAHTSCRQLQSNGALNLESAKHLSL